MNYAIIGTGILGSTLARLLTRAGIAASIANTRGPETIRPLVEELGDTLTAGTLEDALAADVVFLAIPFTAVEEFVRIRADWTGKIVIDATNNMTCHRKSWLGVSRRTSSPRQCLVRRSLRPSTNYPLAF
jgi:predicted dinucleotide-binding enzyme